jgi:hypothetical protein
MAITLTISTNRQIRTSDGGSIGATAGITLELLTPATATDAELQREIRHHYETITGAVRDQLAALNGKPTIPPPTVPNGTPKTTTPLPAAAEDPKPNGQPASATAAVAQRPTPPQPAAQRIALDAGVRAQLNAQFQAEDDDELDQEDDTPRTGPELLAWARKQPVDAKQELAQIGVNLRYPNFIRHWTPEQVTKAHGIYTHTSKD